MSVIDARTFEVTNTIGLTTIPLSAEVLQGKRIFNSAAAPVLTKDNWITCASCHFDGGMDGQTWQGFPDGPRNTPALFGVGETLPIQWKIGLVGWRAGHWQNADGAGVGHLRRVTRCSGIVGTKLRGAESASLLAVGAGDPILRKRERPVRPCVVSPALFYERDLTRVEEELRSEMGTGAEDFAEVVSDVREQLPGLRTCQ